MSDGTLLAFGGVVTFMVFCAFYIHARSVMTRADEQPARKPDPEAQPAEAQRTDDPGQFAA